VYASRPICIVYVSKRHSVISIQVRPVALRFLRGDASTFQASPSVTFSTSVTVLFIVISNASVVAGRADDGHAYVLADYSLKASPDGWAREAIKAYHRHHADRIIAEVNNGGALVEARSAWSIRT
jgi:hypothetical protein